MWCTGVHLQGASDPLWPVGGGALRAHYSHCGRCRVVGAILPVMVVVVVVPLMGMAGMLALWAMWQAIGPHVGEGVVIAVVTVWWSQWGWGAVLACILF